MCQAVDCEFKALKTGGDFRFTGTASKSPFYSGLIPLHSLPARDLIRPVGAPSPEGKGEVKQLPFSFGEGGATRRMRFLS